MNFEFRKYSAESDAKSVERIWREVGWISEDHHVNALHEMLADGVTLVSEIDGTAESMACGHPGSMRYLERDLTMWGVTAVTTSRVARKLGIAGRLTAEILAAGARSGHDVSVLGAFDIGYYDKFGFGTGSYEINLQFDPAQLKVANPTRPPKRLGLDEFESMHAAMVNRRRQHGAINITSARDFKAELLWTEDGFGLGYCDGTTGELTHFFWANAKGEHGPYRIVAIAYQNNDQFLELMSLVKGLADQVRAISMLEPSEFQMQSLLEFPFRHRRYDGKPMSQWSHASAWWQMRILDLGSCLEKTHLNGPTVRFNLTLTDPVAAYLPNSSDWRGIGGEYVVELGTSSHAELGRDSSLPTLQTSVNAFSRLWIGAGSATGLSVTDKLVAPPALLVSIEQTLRLPRASRGWDF